MEFDPKGPDGVVGVEEGAEDERTRLRRSPSRQESAKSG